jgi:hypothetical protein
VSLSAVFGIAARAHMTARLNVSHLAVSGHSTELSRSDKPSNASSSSWLDRFGSAQGGKENPFFETISLDCIIITIFRAVYLSALTVDARCYPTRPQC